MRLYSSARASKQSRNLDNFQATQLIKNLYLNNGQKPNELASTNNAQQALEIFTSIKEPKNNFSINALLSFFLRNKCTQNIDLIWNDVEILSHHNHSISPCYTPLILCCAESLNLDKCIAVLQIMEKHDHKLTSHNAHIHVATLINKSNPNLSPLKYIDSLLTKHILRPNEYILRALIHAYGRHKDIPSAINAFHFYLNNTHKKSKLLYIKNTVLTLMVHNGFDKEALELYHTINTKQFTDNLTHTLALRACVHLRDYESGHQIYQTLKALLSPHNNTKEDLKMKTKFIDFYGIFGEVQHALHIFESIPDTQIDIVCIGAMLKLFVNNCFYREALQLYDKMDDVLDMFPNASKDTACHVLAVKACANLKDFEKGQHIYHEIVTKNKNQLRNLHLVTAFIDFYGQSKHIQKAIDLFSEHQNKHREANIVCINCMLSAYIDNNYYAEALRLYDAIDIHKTDTTHVLGITACSKSHAFHEGQEIYKEVKHKDNIQIKTSLIDLFGNCKDIESMWNIFHSIKRNKMNIIAVNAMMTALINNDCNKDALYIYDNVPQNMRRDATTYTMAIKACGNLQDLSHGEQTYAQVPSNVDNVQIQTALIQFYGHCREIEKAFSVFNNIANRDKNIVTINSMLTVFINNGYDEKALQLYHEMDSVYSHIGKDSVLYSVAIKACTNSDNFDCGQKIHNEIQAAAVNKLNKEDNDTQLHLINMYSKSGMVHVCEDIFKELKASRHRIYFEDINIWNEMMNAYMRNNSDIIKAKQLLKVMQNETKLTPNYKTYSLLLNGCSHRGDIQEANRIWKDDIDGDTKYESYIIGTLVDCCSRKGSLYEGYEWIYKYERFHKKAANEDKDYAMWMSLLHGTRQRKNAFLAQYIYKQIVTRFNHSAARIKSASVQLANITANTEL